MPKIVCRNTAGINSGLVRFTIATCSPSIPMLPVTLPAEVWLNIVTDHRPFDWFRHDFGQRHRFLASLSLVSPHLRDLIQPLLFESLEFTWYSHVPSTEKAENTWWRIEHLSHWVETRPEVAGWVRRLSLTGSRNPREDSDPFQSEEFMALFKSLKNLRDLRTLELFFNTNSMRNSSASLASAPATLRIGEATRTRATPQSIYAMMQRTSPWKTLR